jgi:hypothetical protein
LAGILKKFVPTEHDEQVALIDWCHLMAHQHPELELIFSIPNGGWRHPATAKSLKLEGAKPGVPDLFLPAAKKGYHGLFLELKRKMQGKLSVSQKTVIEALRDQGYKVEVCKGFEPARDAILSYLL